MKTWIYGWIVYPTVYSIAMVVGFTNKKVRETLRLRSWKDFLSLRFNVGQPIEYWIHVASAGELEYAIPILEELGRLKKRVLVTYYSISAKRAVDQLPQSFPWVSLVVPLPHDGLGLMREFVALIHRQGVRSLLILKYELWPGLLWECNAHGVKVYLVDALRPSWFHKRLLHKLDGILSGYQSEVNAIQHQNIKVLGDTRVERVLQRVENVGSKLTATMTSGLMNLLAERPVLVGGSMWPPDTKLLTESIQKIGDKKKLPHIVWVPHELDEAKAKKAVLAFTELGYAVHRVDDAPTIEVDVALSGKPLAVIVMKKGILVELYRLGDAAYVGGALGAGVHSVWEPALAGLHVACGPRTDRSPEAEVLSMGKILTHVTTSNEMATWISEKLAQKRQSQDANQLQALQQIVNPHRGAARRIVEFCEQNALRNDQKGRA